MYNERQLKLNEIINLCQLYYEQKEIYYINEERKVYLEPEDIEILEASIDRFIDAYNTQEKTPYVQAVTRCVLSNPGLRNLSDKINKRIEETINTIPTYEDLIESVVSDKTVDSDMLNSVFLKYIQTAAASDQKYWGMDIKIAWLKLAACGQIQFEFGDYTLCSMKWESCLEQYYQNLISSNELENLILRVYKIDKDELLMKITNDFTNSKKLISKEKLMLFFKELKVDPKEWYMEKYANDLLHKKGLLNLLKSEVIKLDDADFEKIKSDDIEYFYKQKEFLKIISKNQALKILSLGYSINKRILTEKGLSSADVIGAIENRIIEIKKLITLLQKLPEEYIPSPDLLFKTVLTELQELPEDNKGRKNDYITGNIILDLVSKKYINWYRLVDVFETKNEIIPTQKYLAFFDMAKVIDMLGNKEYAERFKKMYNTLKEKHFASNEREYINYQRDFIESFLNTNRKNEEDFKNKLMFLIKSRVVEPEIGIEYLSYEYWIELYNENLIGNNDIFPLLQASQIEDLYYEGKVTIQELVDGLGSGTLSSKKFFKLIKKEEMVKHIIDNEIKPHSVLDAYMHGHITAQDIGEIATDENGRIDINKLNIDEYSVPVNDEENEEQQQEARKGYVQKIEELLLLGIINYDKLVELKDNGVINSDEFKIICDTKANYEAIEAIRRIKEVENSAEPEGGKRDNLATAQTGKVAKKYYYIDPDLIDRYLSEISKDEKGNETAIRRPITSGALEGYTIVCLPNMKVVVLEKMYQKKTRDNATFVLQLIKAKELAESSNKTDLRKEPNVISLNHTQNFGKNLLKTIELVQETTVKEDSKDTIWAKNLLGEDAVEKLIAKIIQNYKDNRDH